MTIELKNIIKKFGDKEVIKNLSLSIDSKKFTVLLGESGSGKTTVLRIIAGLEKIDNGKIIIDGKDVTYKEAHERGISMVFQSYALFPHMTAKENIIFGLKVRKEKKDTIEAKLKRIASLLNITEILNRKPSQLSGGQRQRIALARAIISGRKICLMDEPLSNLDARLRDNMRKELKNLQQTLNLTVVYVTHDQIEAMSMADKIILIREGKIEQEGTPYELYNFPKTIYTAKFIGTPPMNVITIEEIKKENILPKLKFPETAKYIGIRPENFEINTKKIFFGTGEIKFTEYCGSETIHTIKIGKILIYLKTSSKTNIKAGKRIKIYCDYNDLRFFDKNGQLLIENKIKGGVGNEKNVRSIDSTTNYGDQLENLLCS
ncbi:ABC transporter related protein [Thermodesulfatator indicus DSM 15286]|uniref:ABC transporter related protein n=1 Tax=Thermodesulfatator indicus (strain DSM 15286 / JCM 11887 / CIR29812) TaxID=667014 RepID=F8ABU4_THEID|nr:ABC transporter ATP-binding protein [Thermodesulfatator indicus]AEH44554.1 ABC transporter related protein [Thermodesulfatator indicus DSM 15286]